MKTKLELYREWLDDAKEAHIQTELNIRWMVRVCLQNPSLESELAKMQAQSKQQERYIEFIEEVVKEQEKEEAKVSV